MTRGQTNAGFTLLELLVVITLVAVATAGVSLSLRDGTADALDREAERLAALLESARAQSRASGIPVRWQGSARGFSFDGLPPGAALPGNWLSADTVVHGTASLLLGPEPIIGPQAVVLGSASHSVHSVRVATDGLRPFTTQTQVAP